MFKQYYLLIIIAFLLGGCKGNQEKQTIDPVAASLQYQSWEDTQQPKGSPAYLAMGTYSKVLCTAVFESGREADEAFINSRMSLFVGPEMEDIRYEIDEVAKRATIFLDDSIQRSATYVGDQGCIIDGHTGLQFEPVVVKSSLPNPESTDWPMGDRTKPLSQTYNQATLLEQAMDAAFAPEALTAAFLVIHKGEIIAERYREDIDMHTQLESWSMGKSLTATLIGRLIQMGKLSLDQAAPVNEWQREGDPRKEITIKNLLQMSSGLRFPSHQDPNIDIPLPLLAHLYIYEDAINVFDFAVNRPLQFAPGSVGRYRNSDPLTLGYILRNIVEAEGRNYWAWPQEELFDKVGIRRQLLETDPYGNFIMSGFDYGTARNWGRLGMLYLQDGMWEGERLLPEGFADFVSAHAPGWEEPIYGGLFWLNGTEQLALPKDAYSMAGAGGQRTIIVPSLDLVVVRMGHSKGADHAFESMNNALEILVQALKD